MMKQVSKVFYLLMLILYPAALVWGQQSQPQNVIFILSDDHRYDYMGFHPESPDFLQTPGMDRMAEEGAHVANAFVSTSLCSPSLASILTGQYPFRHRIVDKDRKSTRLN